MSGFESTQQEAGSTRVTMCVNTSQYICTPYTRVCMCVCVFERQEVCIKFGRRVRQLDCCRIRGAVTRSLKFGSDWCDPIL